MNSQGGSSVGFIILLLPVNKLESTVFPVEKAMEEMSPVQKLGCAARPGAKENGGI